MKTTKKARLRFRFGGRFYSVLVNSISYTGTLIINKLKIGQMQLWLVLQNGVWRFIGDMPLCKQLKNILLAKITALHGLAAEAAEQVPLRSGILLNALLSVLALKKELPV